MNVRGELDQLSQAAVDWLLTSGPRIFFILIGALLVRRFLHGLVTRIGHALPVRTRVSEHEKRISTLLSLLRTLVSVVVLVVTASMILREFGVAIGPILASAGIVGVVAGFGAQNLVRDLVSGFFMLLENQYREGDVIRAAGVEGQVEAFGIRATVLRDFEGNVHYVPNGEIKILTNVTQDWSRAVIDVEVSYRSNMDHVTRILQQVIDELKDAPTWRGCVSDSEVLGIERLGESAVVVRVALRTAPESRQPVGREFRRRALLAFEKAGIEIPFPHRTLYIGEGRQGQLDITALLPKA